MNIDFLPEKYLRALKNINLNKLYELRLRKDYAVKINIDSKWNYLGVVGIVASSNSALICSGQDINNIIMRVTEKSVYAFNDYIKQGFLTIGGNRIGLCGDCVFSANQIVTIKNISSLNIRFSHEIEDCSNAIIKHIFNGEKLFNTLIISPPFCGKTTILKDLAYKLNDMNIGSILIIDERGEFENIKGENIDRIAYSDKFYAFSFGIRSMSPNIIITDELSSDRDWKYVKQAIYSGVKILASCHADDIYSVHRKDYFEKGLFDRYIVLDDKGIPGVIKNIYDMEYCTL